MNRLEFNTVMKAVDIQSSNSTVSERDDKEKKLYFWKDISLNYGGNDYVIVRGKIPLEVAMTIYEKYPENRYGIRVCGGYTDWNPKYYAQSDDASRNDAYQYVRFYHVDTKEGLIILLTEMKDYYKRHEGLEETEVARISEIIAEVNEKILKKINPQISTNEWMQTEKQNRHHFFETVERTNETDFGQELRSLLEEFDKVVNPYMNDDVTLDDIKNYIQKVRISAIDLDEICDKCVTMHIHDINSWNHVSYYRTPDGFSYQLKCDLGNQQYFSALHYYVACGIPFENGEGVAIEYFGDSSKQNIEVRYNLTNGIAGRIDGEKGPITPLQKNFLLTELKKAIEYAKAITVDKMELKGKEKTKY